MSESTELPPLRARRPSWFLGQPQMEFDCRTTAGLAPTLQELLETAARLSPGQMFVVRNDYDPVLLCRILANRGFTQWSEEDGQGGHRVYFKKVTW